MKNKFLRGTVLIIAILLSGFFLLVPPGQRMATIADLFTADKVQIPPVAQVENTQPEVTVPAKLPPSTVGSMQVGDIAYAVPAAVVELGTRNYYLDPGIPIHQEESVGYVIKIERKLDGFYVKGRAYKSGWRVVHENTSTSIPLIPITRME